MAIDVMRPTKRQTVTGVTTDRIRELILCGELRAGEPLRQDDLAERLGVSRTPLREAIIILQSEGLVINHPHRGAVVYKPTRAELQEIYEIRALLETHAARHAAEHITPAQLAAVEKVVRQLDQPHEPGELVALNRAFRTAIYSACEKPYLLDLILTLTRRAEPYLHLLVAGPRRPFRQEEFAELLDALRTRNGDLAAEITRRHLDTTVAAVLPMLDD